MPNRLIEPPFLEPDPEPLIREQRERDTREVSIVRRAQRQIELADLRGTLDDVSREQIESFADRLIRENVAKQAEPEIVARYVRRFQRVMDDAQRDSVNVSKRFRTAYVPKGGHKDTPRTVFGTEAWFKASPYTIKKFVNKTIALPCVERQVRRQVMAAKRLLGRGYRVRHRKLPFSDIGC